MRCLLVRGSYEEISRSHESRQRCMASSSREIIRGFILQTYVQRIVVHHGDPVPDIEA